MNRILRSGVLAVVILAAVVTTTVGPVEAKIFVFTANLSGANSVPPVDTPIVGNAVFLLDARGGIGVSDLELATRAPLIGSVTAAFEGYLANLAPGSRVTWAEIRKGGAGTNGPVRVDSGISPADPVGATDDRVIFSRFGRFVTPNDALALIGNPSDFHVNVRVTFNPTVEVRGQLQLLDPFQFGFPFPGLVINVYTNQATFVAGERFRARAVTGNYSLPRQADIFVGLIKTAAESLALCPTPNDRALQFRGPGGVTSDECQSNLDKPGNRAIPLLTNVTIPVEGLHVVPLADESLNLPPGQRSFFVCAATPNTVQRGIPTLTRCASASFTVLAF